MGVGGQGNLMYKRRKAYKRTVFNFVLQFILTFIMKRRTWNRVVALIAW